MEYINEVVSRMRRNYTNMANNFYVLMEYIDEVSFRMRRFFTLFWRILSASWFFHQVALLSELCKVLSKTLSKIISSGLSSSHEVSNLLATHKCTSRK